MEAGFWARVRLWLIKGKERRDNWTSGAAGLLEDGSGFGAGLGFF